MLIELYLAYTNAMLKPEAYSACRLRIDLIVNRETSYDRKLIYFTMESCVLKFRLENDLPYKGSIVENSLSL